MRCKYCTRTHGAYPDAGGSFFWVVLRGGVSVLKHKGHERKLERWQKKREGLKEEGGFSPCIAEIGKTVLNATAFFLFFLSPFLCSFLPSSLSFPPFPSFPPSLFPSFHGRALQAPLGHRRMGKIGPIRGIGSCHAIAPLQ